MKNLKQSLEYKNITGRPARSIALITLCALLSFCALSGTLIVSAFRTGLSSLEKRMGADIMVVPYEATTRKDIDLENVLLLGNTGYFYMDKDIVDKIASREGVSEVSAQFFLSSVSAGCCSVPVQIVGFDRETDFTIRPWIADSYGKELQENEVVVGSDLNAFVGDTLTFYNTDVTVAAKLTRTGTHLDTAVYAGEETLRHLIGASQRLGLNTYKNADPDRVVSSVLVNVTDEAAIDDVLNDINIHVRKVKAYRTKTMMEGLVTSLDGMALVIVVAVVAVWLLCAVIMALTFAMSVRERKKEFAVLRTLGASATKLSSVVWGESLLLGLTGAVIGIFLSLLIVLPFARLIESAMDLPFLMPSAGRIVTAVCFVLLMTVVIGILSASTAARRAAATDAGLLLREA